MPVGLYGRLNADMLLMYTLDIAFIDRNTSVLTSKDAMDNMRIGVECQAFEQFIDEFELLWKNVARQYSGK